LVYLKPELILSLKKQALEDETYAYLIVEAALEQALKK
jgi:hypothetical protein